MSRRWAGVWALPGELNPEIHAVRPWHSAKPEVCLHEQHLAGCPSGVSVTCVGDDPALPVIAVLVHMASENTLRLRPVAGIAGMPSAGRDRHRSGDVLERPPKGSRVGSLSVSNHAAQPLALRHPSLRVVLHDIRPNPAGRVACNRVEFQHAVVGCHEQERGSRAPRWCVSVLPDTGISFLQVARGEGEPPPGATGVIVAVGLPAATGYRRRGEQPNNPGRPGHVASS
jgi:hypothetical protein